MQLSRFALFHDAPVMQVAALESRLPDFQRQRGELLYREGEPAKALYLISAGMLRFERVSAAGQGFIYGIGTPGHAYGELELVLNTARHATAVAMGELRGRLLPLALFNELYAGEGWFSRNLCTELARSTRLNQSLYRNVLTLAPPVRLARALLWLAGHQQPESPGESLSLSQEELAHVLGLSRQSINKYLKSWQEQGWIDVGYGSVRVLDLVAMGAISAGT